MLKIPQFSFRRILLLGLLGITVPILVGGILVTYRKARSAFLETARQNLTESAIKRGQDIDNSIQALRTHLVTASDSIVLRSEKKEEYSQFFSQLKQILPSHVDCVQLVDANTLELSKTTCEEERILDVNPQWPEKQTQRLMSPEQVYVELEKISPENKAEVAKINQLVLILATPIYNLQGDLTDILIVRAALLKQEKPDPGILLGYPVVINQQGLILAHPIPNQVGRNINELPDADRLNSILSNAISGKEYFLHLFALEKNGIEVVAGYSAIPNPVSREEGQHWVILAVTPLEDALSPLASIWQVLLGMGVVMMFISIGVMLGIAHILARPLENLRDYAMKTKNLEFNEPIPQNSYIKEVKQLSQALNDMINRLTSWAKQVEKYWEEAKIANQLKSEFLATTSHELRTPLNGIIGCIQLVKDGFYDDEAEQQQLLLKSEESANYLLKLISDILDISRIEAGKLSVNLESVEVNKLVKDVIELERFRIESKKLTLSYRLQQEKLTVWADPSRLKQVIINVISNAIKFTETGGISIAIFVDNQEKLRRQNGNHAAHTVESNSVVISVKDTGIGIDPRQQDKLFRPFEMIDASRTRKYEGTGLGLAISHNLMHLMGGTITIYSEGANQGTIVQMRLPLIEQESPHLLIN